MTMGLGKNANQRKLSKGIFGPKMARLRITETGEDPIDGYIL
jgi:hypothetical protein